MAQNDGQSFKDVMRSSSEKSKRRNWEKKDPVYKKENTAIGMSRHKALMARIKNVKAYGEK